MRISKSDARYIAAYYAADKANIARWMSGECVECNQIPSEGDDMHIADSDGVILVCCEGYYQINPQKLGIAGNWQDWNTRCANCDLQIMEIEPGKYADNSWGEYTCPISLGGNRVRHGILAHKLAE